MDKRTKKRIQRYLSWVALAALVVCLAVMPLMAGSQEEAEGPQASILSATVENGSITTCLKGGGTLAAEDAVEILIPTGVKITEFLVQNGDTVSQGDPLASVDRVSVMSAITQVQDTMDYLLEEMADVTDQEASSQIKAQAGGLVKQVFAEKGDKVQDVMLEHGALAVLSLDGLMAVEISRQTALSTGDSVCVTFEDETEVNGRVESNMDGVLVVTVEDDGYAVGEKVVVSGEDGTRIGSGALYVHNAWNAVAYTGTVSSVSVKPEDSVYAGRTILTLTDTEFNGQLESLANQHRDYEDLMLQLFQMYQSNVIAAPCDGMVSGVDQDSIHLLAGTGEGWTLSLLANAPGADPDAGYDNHVGQLTGMLGSKWTVQFNPTAQTVTDYMADMEALDTSVENMTFYDEIDMVTVYKLVDGQWEISTAAPGDILLFALGSDGFVWAVYLGTAEVTPSDPTVPSEPSTEPTEPEASPTEPAGPGEVPTDPSDDAETPSLPESGEDADTPTDKDKLEDLISGGMSGSMAGGFSGGGYVQEEEYELYDLEGSTLMSVTPQTGMTLTITLDEQDIASVQLGMTAEVTVEALKNQSFSAVVTEIGDTGTNNGGSSKFTVELSLDMQENMLAGMSAVASIPLSTLENIPVIPVAALVEEGSRTLVYTGYDEKTGELTGSVDVTLGISDGIHAQILSGLEAGDSFWYSYYDTLELDTSVEAAGFSFG